jgi:hypothetical protein
MDDQPQVSVAVNLKPSDVYSPFHLDRGNVIRWVAAALLCLFFRDLYTSSRETLQSFPGGASITAVMIVLVVFVLFAILLFPYLRVRALFRSTPSLRETSRITFRPDKILFQSESAQSECKWTIFNRVSETREAFAFSQGKIGATYVPKRFFANPNDIQLLRRLIRENFKGELTLRSD